MVRLLGRGSGAENVRGFPEMVSGGNVVEAHWLNSYLKMGLL
jgi:hypothetical protein